MANFNPENLLAALGGAENIDEIEGCITRLRTVVNDSSKVDEPALMAEGAKGVMISGDVVQVIVGPQAEMIADDINDLMD
ncbi:glucose PTS transporter subunit EIIB [Corynebacterium aquilae]|uniref:PTS sugar transporter n=1 Tax=Corynebacterium aquilae DSM 44791 TaxID=1431546 RepID=A0A1L7CGF6_9CORY|nr:PTS glucose/sucrose transporter subunit IIB [Corynebacterium aquilae]APT84904.1 PTS sugar transporter [Corynebacterium aquilae DSM 44791]